jgi:hypothetical protein
MPTVRTIYSEAKVKVAVVFKPEGGMCPVWFEILGVARVQISEVTASWTGSKGAAKVINFELWGGERKPLPGVQRAEPDLACRSDRHRMMQLAKNCRKTLALRLRLAL